MLSKVKTKLSELSSALGKLENALAQNTSNQSTIYVGLHCMEMLNQLQLVQDTLESLESETDLTEAELQNKIQEKQELITSESQFMKTFSPLMMLYQLGYLRRNWE